MAKTCHTCQISKPLSDFSRFAKNDDGLHIDCRVCRSDYKKHQYINRTPEQVLRDQEYRKRWNNQNRAKVKADNKAWRLKNRKGVQEHFRKRNYGLSNGAYDKLLQHQNGKCAICKTQGDSRRNFALSVDHDHETGVVRGILCSRCNVALGGFRDNIALMQSAIQYLMTPTTQGL